MITLICEKFNTFHKNNIHLQHLYDELIRTSISFSTLQCSCGNDHCLTKHGYYNRNMKTPLGSVSLTILRVKCSVCQHTHAIMPSCIVPFSQILFSQHLEIIQHPLSSLEQLMTHFSIDESHIRYIKKQFRIHWKQRLKDKNLSFHDMLCSSFFHHFKCQFMQIRRLVNLPFLLSG